MTCSFLLGGQLGILSNLLGQSAEEMLRLYEYSQGTYNRRTMEVETNDPGVVTIRSFTLDDPPPLKLRRDVGVPRLQDTAGFWKRVNKESPEKVRRRIENVKHLTTIQKSLLLEQYDQYQATANQESASNKDSVRNQGKESILPHSKPDADLVGNRNVTIQPLFSWEKIAIETRACQTPHRGIPKHCCPGSYSAGGRLLFFEGVCNSTEPYEIVQEYAMEYLKKPYLARDKDDECDACSIVETLMELNLTLSFVGDSLTRQSNAGLECELLRRGYMVRSKKSSVTKREGCSWRDCIGEWMVFTVTNPTNMKTATFNHFGMYRPDPSNLDLKEIILPHSDIVIFDHGLHWKPKEQARFAEAMTRYLQGFQDANLTMLAWRETSAQHIDSDGGHYGLEAKSKNCVPIHPDHQAGYRMPIMQQAAENAGLQWRSLAEPDFSAQDKETNEIVFLPFRDYTVPLHYLHPNECTHYCHTPYLWLPLWRSLRIALDRAVAPASHDN
ncbi:unnamed protein product [Cylindrotheca closterium]|uniref:Uncharacterized protein n=1 Tax=Cylindrotheca closterium TaxID=2856 RepID=A0AAD2FFN5_9STRA|nr:unnamed protein product [Cylindrotheca closterium]